jgi:hypothetical protein
MEPTITIRTDPQAAAALDHPCTAWIIININENDGSTAMSSSGQASRDMIALGVLQTLNRLNLFPEPLKHHDQTTRNLFRAMLKDFTELVNSR